jgi:hypothetical protein
MSGKAATSLIGDRCVLPAGPLPLAAEGVLLSRPPDADPCRSCGAGAALAVIVLADVRSELDNEKDAVVSSDVVAPAIWNSILPVLSVEAIVLTTNTYPRRDTADNLRLGAVYDFRQKLKSSYVLSDNYAPTIPSN